MKRTLSGIVVVALTGSLYLSNAHGNIQADTGHSYVLPVSDQPLVAVDQDGVQEALERLEKLATRIAALEKEISGLEKANAQLKKQLAAVGQGWAGSSRRYGVEGVKKGQFRGQGGGGMRFVEPVKKNKKKEDK